MLRKIVKTILILSLMTGTLVLLAEFALYGLFELGWLEKAPLLQTRTERARGLVPPARIVYENNVPHRSQGLLTAKADCMICSLDVPNHVVEFDGDGARKDSFEAPARCTIGVFGDGFASGIEVSESALFTTRMEQSLRKHGYDVNIKNFGLGNTGTTVQFLRYEQLVEKGYKFDVIVLVFNPAQNVAHNSLELNNSFHFLDSYPFFVIRDDKLTRSDWTRDQFSLNLYRPVRDFLANYSHFANLAYAWKIRYQSRSRKKRGPPSVYQLSQEPAWSEAWNLTERIFEKWRMNAMGRNSQLMTVIVPASLYFKPKKGYDLEYPLRRAREVFQRLEIEHVDLYSVFQKYIETEKLDPPYEVLTTGLHYSETAHQLLARKLKSALKSNLASCRLRP